MTDIIRIGTYVSESRRGYCAVKNAQILVRNYKVGIDRHGEAETGAGLTRARGIVERKHSRGQFLDAYAVFGAGITLRIRRFFTVGHGNNDKPV